MAKAETLIVEGEQKLCPKCGRAMLYSVLYVSIGVFPETKIPEIKSYRDETWICACGHREDLGRTHIQ